MNNNESQEMYLETILKIKQKKGNVRSIDVAEELNYSKPSVSRAVGILVKNGYITVKKDGGIELTELGLKKSESIFERHKSLTKAFVKMGMPQDSAEDNACKVEHVITEEAFLAIKAHFDV